MGTPAELKLVRHLPRVDEVVVRPGDQLEGLGAAEQRAHVRPVHLVRREGVPIHKTRRHSNCPYENKKNVPVHAPLADFDWPAPDKRREFLRVKRNAEGHLSLFSNQSSGVLTSVAWADGLVDNPPGQVIKRGDRVTFWSLASLMA